MVAIRFLEVTKATVDAIAGSCTVESKHECNTLGGGMKACEFKSPK